MVRDPRKTITAVIGSALASRGIIQSTSGLAMRPRHQPLIIVRRILMTDAGPHFPEESVISVRIIGQISVQRSRPLDKSPFGCSIVTESHSDAHPADHCHPDAGVPDLRSGRWVVPVDGVLAGRRGACSRDDRRILSLTGLALPPAVSFLHRGEDHSSDRLLEITPVVDGPQAI